MPVAGQGAAGFRGEAGAAGSGDDGCGKSGEVWHPDPQSISHCTMLRGSVSFSDVPFADVDNLSSLRAVEGGLNFFRNEQLVNLRGLRNLERVGGDLSIHHSVKLETLEGLEKLEEVGGNLFVTSNFGLRSVTGLDRLESVGGLSISGNPLLPESEVEALRTKLKAP